LTSPTIIYKYGFIGENMMTKKAVQPWEEEGKAAKARSVEMTITAWKRTIVSSLVPRAFACTKINIK